MMGKYVIVRESNSPYTFTKYHNTFEMAKAEAERLCRKERTRFMVLAAIAFCDIDEIPVKWTIEEKE